MPLTHPEIDKWFKDPGFQGLPDEEKASKIENFFDRNLATDDFYNEPIDNQAKFRQNFVNNHFAKHEPLKESKGETQYNVKGALKGAGLDLAAFPSRIISGVGQGMQRYVDPIKEYAAKATAERSGKTFDSEKYVDEQRKGDVLAKSVMDFGKVGTDYYAGKAQQDKDVQAVDRSIAEGNESLFTQALRAAGHTGGGVAVSMVPGVGPILAGAGFFNLNKEEAKQVAYQKLIETGVPEQEAEKRAEDVSWGAGAITSLLDTVGAGKIANSFKPAGKLANFLIGMLITSQVEGTTEGLQNITTQIAGDYAARPKGESTQEFIKKTVAKLPEYAKGAVNDYAVGALMGGGFHAVGGGFGSLSSDRTVGLSPDQQQSIQGFFTEAGQKFGLQPRGAQQEAPYIQRLRSDIENGVTTLDEVVAASQDPETIQSMKNGGIDPASLESLVAEYQERPGYSELAQTRAALNSGQISTAQVNLMRDKAPEGMAGSTWISALNNILADHTANKTGSVVNQKIDEAVQKLDERMGLTSVAEVAQEPAIQQQEETKTEGMPWADGRNRGRFVEPQPEQNKSVIRSEEVQNAEGSGRQTVPVGKEEGAPGERVKSLRVRDNEQERAPETANERDRAGEKEAAQRRSDVEGGTGEQVKQVHDFSNTQVDIPKEEAKAFKEFNKKIPDSEIYEDPKDPSYGREEEPHITVKYGLDTVNPKDVEPLLAYQKPIKAKMGKVSIFESDDYDVVKVDIESPELLALNKKISDNLKVTDTFPDYNPHTTIAYVKKGEGKKYVGDKSFEGKEVVFNSLTFSGKDGKLTEIPLGSIAPGKKENVNQDVIQDVKGPEDNIRLEKERKENRKRELARNAKDFRTWLIHSGGINRQDPTFKGEIRDIVGKKGMTKGFSPKIFKKDALGVDILTQKAIEDGWLPKGATEDDFMRAFAENQKIKALSADSEKMVEKAFQDEYNRLINEGATEDELREIQRAGEEEALGEVEKRTSGTDAVDEDGFDWSTGEYANKKEKLVLTPPEETPYEKAARLEREGVVKRPPKGKSKAVFKTDEAIQNKGAVRDQQNMFKKPDQDTMFSIGTPPSPKVDAAAKADIAKRNNVPADSLVFHAEWRPMKDRLLYLYNVIKPGHPSHGSTLAYDATTNSEVTGPDVDDRNKQRQVQLPDKFAPVPVNRIETLSMRTAKSWSGAPEIVVAPTQADLPNTIVYSKGSRVSGAYRDGKVYLVAENIPTLAFARKTIAHEVIGHHGMKVLRDNPDVTPRLDRLMDRLYKTETAAIDKIAGQYGYDVKSPDGKSKAVEEWLARKVEENPKDTWVRRAVSLIREWLSKVMPNLKVSNSEISSWIGQMRKAAVTEQPGTFDPTNPDIRFSQESEPQDQPRFSMITPEEFEKQQAEESLKATDKPTFSEDLSGVQIATKEAPTSKMREVLVISANDAMYWVVDKNRPIATVQKYLNRKSDEMDVFLKETQRPKVTAAKVKKAWDDDIKPLISRMSEFKVTREDFELYKHALHAPEANDALRKANAKSQVEKIKNILDAKEDKEKRNFINEQTKDAVKPEEWYSALNNIISKFKNDPKLKATIAKWAVFSEKPSGMTDKEALKIQDQYKNNRKIQDLSAMLDSINDKKLQLLYDSGLLSKEEYQSIKNKYNHYVPLYREGYSDMLSGPARGIKPSGRPVKVRGGSTRNVVDIMAHSIANYEKAINLAEKARSQKALYDLIKNNPESDIISISEVPKSPRYDAHGNLIMYPDMFKVADNEMGLVVDGKRYTVSVDRNDKDAMLMLRTLKAEDSTTGPILNTLSRVNRFLARVNTSWSPEFIISNFVRDIQTAGVNIKDTGVKNKKMMGGSKDAIRAIYAVERGKPKGSEYEEYYERFKAAGGKIGWADVHSSITNLSKKITAEIEMQAGNRPVRKRVNDWFKLIEDLNTSIENGVRLHVFKLAVEQGKSDERAAQIASDLTVDFTKKGAAGPVINSLYLFANAGIQGSYRIIRAASKSRSVQKSLAGIAGAGFAVGLFNALVGGDDEDGEDYFNKIDDFIRERNMIIMLPGTGGKYVKIPLPWGYNFFWNIGSEISRAFTKEEYSALKGAGRLISVFANAFNPVASGTLLQTIAPTIADPIAQIAENKNWFGGDLMPQRDKYAKVPTPESQRYWSTTGVASKWITSQLNSLTGGDTIKSGVIDVSPEVLDLIVASIGGSAVRFMTDTLGVPLKLAQQEGIEWNKIPFWRRVAGNKSEWSDSKTYYENSEDINIAEARLKAYRGTPEYKKIVENSKFEIKMIQFAKTVESRLRKLRKALKVSKAKNDKERTKLIEDRIERLYVMFNKKYYEVKQDFKEGGSQ